MGKDILNEYIRKQHEDFIKEMRENESLEEKEARETREKEHLKAQYEVNVLTLHCAAARGKLDEVKYYIEKRKIKVDSLAEGRTALYYAVRMCHENVARYLLDKGADQRFAIKAYESALEDTIEKVCGNVANSAGSINDKCSTH